MALSILHAFSKLGPSRFGPQQSGSPSSPSVSPREIISLGKILFFGLFRYTGKAVCAVLVEPWEIEFCCSLGRTLT